jgi:hypothetical protein
MWTGRNLLYKIISANIVKKILHNIKEEMTGTRKYEIRSSQCSEYEECSFLGCYTM